MRTESLLVLTLTRRCDRRCGFCPQEFAERDMSEAVLDAALEGLLPRLAAPRRLKLFGGEPLLRPDLAARALERAARLAPEAPVELNTHGGGLAEAEGLLSRHPRLELFVSRPLPEAARVPGAVHNFLLPPDETLPRTIERFLAARAAGFTRFNFLPAYFTAWTPPALALLRARFEALRRLLAVKDSLGRRAEAVNPGRRGSTPLYNDGLVVDVDGEVYSSSLVLTAAVGPRRGDLRLGSVAAPEFLAAEPPASAAGLMAEAFPPPVIASTFAVDAELTGFCRALGAAA